MSITVLLVSVLVGSGAGALLGATRSCADGGCPLTANPWRGALWGGFLGLMLAGTLAGSSRGTAGSSAPVEPPAQAAAASPEVAAAPAETANPVAVVRTVGQLDAVLARPGRSALLFHADWCAPCRTYGPTFEKVAAGSAGKTGFFEADVDAAREVAERLRVEGVPTTVIFEDGKEVARLVGVVAESRLRQATGL